MNPPAEQIVRDYLNRLSIAARGRLGLRDRQALLDQVRARIDVAVGVLTDASEAQVRQALAALGDPVRLIDSERAKISRRKETAIGSRFAAANNGISAQIWPAVSCGSASGGDAASSVQESGGSEAAFDLQVPGSLPATRAVAPPPIVAVADLAGSRASAVSLAASAGAAGTAGSSAETGLSVVGGSFGSPDAPPQPPRRTIRAESSAQGNPHEANGTSAPGSLPRRVPGQAKPGPARLAGDADQAGGTGAGQPPGRPWILPVPPRQRPVPPRQRPAPLPERLDDAPAPARSQPDGVDPDRVDPDGVHPDRVDPDGVDPDAVDPDGGRPGAGDPGPGGRDQDEPGSLEPGQDKPGPGGSGPTPRRDQSAGGKRATWPFRLRRGGRRVSRDDAAPAQQPAAPASAGSGHQVGTGGEMEFSISAVEPADGNARTRLAVARSRIVARLARIGTELLTVTARDTLEAIALVLLALGGAIYPPIWVIGVVFALSSRKWDRRDKWLGLGLPVVLVIFGAILVVLLGGERPSIGSYAGEAWLAASRLSRVGAVLGAGYLFQRLRKYEGQRVQRRPHWAPPRRNR